MKRFFVLLIAVFSLFVVSCYSWYEQKVDMDSKTPKSNLSDLLYKEKEITELEPPKQIIVSKGEYSGTIKIHWNEVPYATSYRLERAVIKPDSETGVYAVPDEGDFEVLNRYVYTCNYSDIILAAPADANKEYSNHYYYRVSAENIKKGLESSEFTPIDEQSSGWLLSPPSSIDAAKGDNPDYIQISWSRVSSATKYIIYRGEKSNGLGMEYLDSVTSNRLSYNNYLSENEKGVEFYYKVCAALPNGSQSAFTGLALGYSSKPGAPSAPGGIQVTNGQGVSKKELSIKWNSVTSTGYTITYSVYRTSSTDSIYTLIRNNIPQNVTTFTDESLLKTGVKYYYYLQAVAVNNSDPSDILKSAFSKTGPNPDAPENEAVGWLLSPPGNCEIADVPDANKVSVRWAPSVGYESVDYLYNIYYSGQMDGDYQLLQQDIQPDVMVNLADDGYYSLTVDKKPFYKLTTINLSVTKESEKSQTIAPCPSAPVNVVASKTSALNGLENYTANTNGVYPVKITWRAPSGENPYGYHVYRSTKPDSAFRKITDSPITGDSLEFVDSNETARAGTFYYYKVVSLNILMQGKNSNLQTADSRGYGALTRDQWFREYNKTVKHSQTKLTLMHKGSTDALGSESAKGDISGSLSYNASMQGLGARIIMRYDNYADYYIMNNSESGVYFLLSGESNTTANMSANGTMDGTVTSAASAMYPGYAKYDKLEIKGGGAGGGYYIVCTKDKNGNLVLGEGNVDWTVGEE